MLTSTPVVSASGLSKRFGDFTAVDRLDLEIGGGEVMGFLGPNGAGKSTTIKMLCGLLRPTAGSARVAGYDIASQAQQVRENIGYMSQKFSLYADLSVAENLRFFAGIYRVDRAMLRERLEFAVDMAGLRGREEALVGTLAGGWKQRLALGCAILHRPRVLFLDEPTSGVEPEARRRFWELIHQLAGDGVTVLVSTHYMDEAEYCNRVVLIDRGRLVASGSPGQLRRQELGGDLLEVACEPLGAAQQALLQQPGVIDCAVFGDRLHLLLQPATDVGAVLGALQRQGLRCDPPRAVAPSLEDVFVRLVARNQAAEPRP